jgi:hypothetical protein
VTFEIVNNIENYGTGATLGFNVSVVGFETDGQLLHRAPGTRKRRIEIIGDSITAGVGNVLLDPCKGSFWTGEFSRYVPLWPA